MVVMPEKRFKGRKLSPEQKSINTLISSIRVKVEYDIGGVKRCRIILNQNRLPGWQVRDRITNVAYALHNLRCHRWAV